MNAILALRRNPAILAMLILALAVVTALLVHLGIPAHHVLGLARPQTHLWG